jgi:nucleotide-binding universal stress UspA family protein
MKSLLMATDLSGRSDRALQRAIMLAQQHGAKLEILNIVDETLPNAALESLEKTATASIESQVAASPHAAGATLTTRVIRGHDYEDIISRAEEIEADLIVLGIHRHKARALFRGTTSERVLRLGRFPVLVVKEPPAQNYQRVLVGVDFSVHSRHALECAADLAPDALFCLAHATHIPFKTFIGRQAAQQIARADEHKFRSLVEKELLDLAGRSGKSAPRCEIVVKPELAHDFLQAQVKEFKPDLIAIGTHGRSGIADAVLGSVAETLLADAPVDVLAVKAW